MNVWENRRGLIILRAAAGDRGAQEDASIQAQGNWILYLVALKRLFQSFNSTCRIIQPVVFNLEEISVRESIFPAALTSHCFTVQFVRHHTESEISTWSLHWKHIRLPGGLNTTMTKILQQNTEWFLGTCLGAAMTRWCKAEKHQSHYEKWE